MEELSLNYSVDMMKKYAFIDELNNYLNILPPEDKDKNNPIIEYIEKRIAHIDKKYKK